MPAATPVLVRSSDIVPLEVIGEPDTAKSVGDFISTCVTDPLAIELVELALVILPNLSTVNIGTLVESP